METRLVTQPKWASHFNKDGERPDGGGAQALQLRARDEQRVRPVPAAVAVVGALGGGPHRGGVPLRRVRPRHLAVEMEEEEEEEEEEVVVV